MHATRSKTKTKQDPKTQDPRPRPQDPRQDKTRTANERTANSQIAISIVFSFQFTRFYIRGQLFQDAHQNAHAWSAVPKRAMVRIFTARSGMDCPHFFGPQVLEWTRFCTVKHKLVQNLIHSKHASLGKKTGSKISEKIMVEARTHQSGLFTF
jgi:hypothetical protein